MKRCRYERKHTCSLVHSDWHRTSIDHPHVIVWLNDASRYALSGGEFPETTGEHSIATFQKAQETGMKLNLMINEVNTIRHRLRE